MDFFWSILAAKMGAKTTPNRSQNESKIKTENASLFYRSWIRLGPVLGRSWAHLGGVFGHFALVFPMFFEHRHFRTNDGSRRIFGPTWPDLGFQKGSKRSPRRAQNGPKTSPKLSSKSKRKNDRKMDRPGLHDQFWPSHFWAQMARRGGVWAGSTNQPRPILEI